MQLYLWYFQSCGLWVPMESSGTLRSKILCLSMFGAVVESLPWGDWDNIAVSLAIAALSRCVFAQ